MLPLIIPVGALLAGVALLLMGSGLLNTLLALRGGLEGYDEGTLGLIMSGYFVGFFIGTFLALPLIKRIGHIRAFAFCAALISTSVLLHILFVNPYIWMLLRVMTGSMLVILYTLIESWLNGQTPKEQRGRVFAVYMIVNLSALTIAQQFLRIESPMSFVLFAIAAMFISVSLVPVTWTRLKQPVVSNVTRMSVRKLFQIAPVAVAGSAFSGLAMGAFWGMIAVYAGGVGFSTGNTGNFISCAILGGAVFQYPLGRYSDAADRRRVLMGVCTAAVFSALLLRLLPDAHPGLFLAIALYGGMAFSVYPIAVAHLIDHLHSDEILPGCSGLLLIHGVCAAIGPAAAGQLMLLAGTQALPVYFAIMQVSLAITVAWHVNRRKEDEVTEGPAQFVPMVRTTPSVLEMLPEESGAAASLDQEPPLKADP